MFRNVFKFPETDINDLIPVEDLVIERDEVGRPKDAQPVDQFFAQPFMMAENGFKRNDVSALMKAESDDLRNMIASRMVELQSTTPNFEGLTDSQIADLVVPKYINSASAFRDWAASKENSGFAKSVQSYIDANKERFEKPGSQIDFKDTEVPKSE
jgi:hypothetical protein